MKKELEYAELDYSHNVPVPPGQKMLDYILVMSYLTKNLGVIVIKCHQLNLMLLYMPRIFMQTITYPHIIDQAIIT